jgi:hypothetical protein
MDLCDPFECGAVCHIVNVRGEVGVSYKQGFVVYAKCDAHGISVVAVPGCFLAEERECRILAHQDQDISVLNVKGWGERGWWASRWRARGVRVLNDMVSYVGKVGMVQFGMVYLLEAYDVGIVSEKKIFKAIKRVRVCGACGRGILMRGCTVTKVVGHYGKVV